MLDPKQKLAVDGTPYDSREFERLRKYRENFGRSPNSRRWPKEEPWKWYNGQSWPCRFNYTPAGAISYTDMWMTASRVTSKIFSRTGGR